MHPDDRHLLGMLWEDQLFIDATLSFGLRSAPKIFNAVADALQWIIRERGVEFIDHYLDDFVIVGRSGSKECERNMATALQVCNEVGAPVAPRKVEGPTTCLEILGIEIDTSKMVLRLPTKKIEAISRLVDVWSERRSGKKVEVVPCGTFMSCMPSGETRKAFLTKYVHSNKSCKKELPLRTTQRRV